MAAQSDDDEPNPQCYEDIKELARNRRRPIRSLLAQSPNTDPFYSGRHSLRRDGEWFAELWHQIGFGKAHLRRIHYALISQAEPVRTPDGNSYENTSVCERLLDQGSRAARHLRLVPPAMFEDRRNEEPIIFIADPSAAPAEVGTVSVYDLAELEELDEPAMTVPAFPAFPELPHLTFSRPIARPTHHIEVWAEKTTMNDVLEPLAERLGINLMTGAGESSITRCAQLIDRARQSRLPVRILYISDFDPAGESIPLTCARKLEYEVRTGTRIGVRRLDVQVRPIVLTHEQCVEYRLPRTPLKDTEGRKGGFEDRYGEGATELDALEALHPGELARIIEAEVNRYRDHTYPRRLADAVRKYRARLAAIEAEALAPFEDAIDALRAEHAELEATYDELTDGADMYGEEITGFDFAGFEALREQVQDLAERSERQRNVLASALREVEPPAFKAPQPHEADEDEDALYDSSRSYLDQIDRYKEHLGKPVQTYRRKKFFIPAQIAEMRELQAQGMGQREIAAHFGVTKNAISYHLTPGARERQIAAASERQRKAKS